MPRAPVDVSDGFVHLSSAAQVEETAAKHFAGQTELLLLDVDETRLVPGTLRWEPSRGGALFPHLYADLPMSAVAGKVILRLDEGGQHLFPAGF